MNAKVEIKVIIFISIIKARYIINNYKKYGIGPSHTFSVRKCLFIYRTKQENYLSFL